MNAESLALVLRLLGIGWYVAVCIGGGAYGGFLLDRQVRIESAAHAYLGWDLGIAVAVVGMVRMILAVFAANSND